MAPAAAVGVSYKIIVGAGGALATTGGSDQIGNDGEGLSEWIRDSVVVVLVLPAASSDDVNDSDLRWFI
jgi:hypothetical protein